MKWRRKRKQYCFYSIARCCCFRSVDVHIKTDVAMMRDADDRVTRIPAYICALPQIVNEGQPLDLGEILASLNQQIADFNKRGSGLELETIDKVILAMSPFLPLCGSMYTPMPTFLKNKHCLVNAQNRNDSKCFFVVCAKCNSQSRSQSSLFASLQGLCEYLESKRFGVSHTTKQIPTF